MKRILCAFLFCLFISSAFASAYLTNTVSISPSIIIKNQAFHIFNVVGQFTSNYGAPYQISNGSFETGYKPPWLDACGVGDCNNWSGSNCGGGTPYTITAGFQIRESGEDACNNACALFTQFPADGTYFGCAQFNCSSTGVKYPEGYLIKNTSTVIQTGQEVTFNINKSYALVTWNPPDYGDANVSVYVGSTFQGIWGITADYDEIQTITFDSTATGYLSLKIHTSVTTSQICSFGVDLVQVADLNQTSSTNITDANVKMRFAFGAWDNVAYDYSSNKYSYYVNPQTSGTYNVDINSSKAGFTDAYDSIMVMVINPISNWLTFTPITNIPSYSLDNIAVNINVTNHDSFIEWRVDSSSGDSEDVTYRILNPLNDGRQYFVYTSADGNNYVFDDTLTYGYFDDNPMQKIWHDENGGYVYSFIDTITPTETKYYRLTYKLPEAHWETIANSNNWLVQLPPSVTEIGGKTVDAYTINSFSNITNELKNNLPQLSSVSNVNYEFQFTAWVASGTPELQVGVSSGGASPSVTWTTLTLDTNATRYSIAINGSSFDSLLQLRTQETTPFIVYITDYALMDRGYFTTRLNIFNQYSNELPTILLSGTAYQFIREGEKFKGQVQAYDREGGDINKLQIQVYLDNNSAANLAKQIDFGINTNSSTYGNPERYLNLNSLFEPVIDLAGNATDPIPPRNIIIKAILYDNYGLQVATQSRTYKFIQYPYFTSDIFTDFTLDSTKVAANPSGQITINASQPDVLQGYDMYIWDRNHTIYNPNYYVRKYKGTDFTCAFSGCVFKYSVPNWAFETQDIYTISVIPILTTEYAYVDNPTENFLIRKDRPFNITFIQFDTAKIWQTVERVDRTYNGMERVSAVLILRDSDRQNLKNLLNVSFKISDCNADDDGGVCNECAETYTTDKFIFDPIGKYNYYFLDSTMLCNGNQFYTGDYVRIKGIVSDMQGKFQSDQNALLTDRCLNGDKDSPNWFANTISSVLNFAFGCNTLSSNVVSQTTNSTEEKRLVIDENHSAIAPTYEVLACLNPDVQDLFVRQAGLGGVLAGVDTSNYDHKWGNSLWCISRYTIGESPIDKMQFYMGTEYSDYSNTDDATKQYLKATLPFELVQYNDIGLMQKALQINQQTTCTTIGCYIGKGFNVLLKTTDFDRALYEQWYNNPLIPNMGADINYSEIADPTHISGLFWWRIEGLDMHNFKDYAFVDGIDGVNPSDLIRYLQYKGVSFKNHTATVTVYGGDFREFYKTIVPANLVFDEMPSELASATADTNTEQDLNKISKNIGGYIPNSVNVDISSILFYNDSLSAIEKYIPMRFQWVVKQGRATSGNSFADGAAHLCAYATWDEFYYVVMTDPLEAFTSCTFNNLLIIFIILVLLVIFSYISLMWRAGGRGITINMPSGGKGGSFNAS